MNSASWQVAHALLADCTRALFDSLGIALTDASESNPAPASSGERLASFIGFSGSEMRGSITIELPCALVARAHPMAASGRALTHPELCDWSGELANQLLGRLKNAIGRHAVTLQLSTPSTMWGRMSHGGTHRAEGWYELTLRAGEDPIAIHFDAVALMPLDLTQVVETSSDAQPEGDMMLFF